MKYIVYLTTNLVNNKIYVGVHGTENPNVFDGYLGNSINRNKPSCINHPKEPFHYAVKKYGFDSFRRNTLQVFDTEEEALDLEALIVNKEFIAREDTYNITLGGGLPPRADKKVYQYDLNGNFIQEWDSLTQAANKYQTSGNLIGISANHKRTAANFLWSFSKVDKLDVSEYSVYNPKIPVYLYDIDKKFIKSYESMSDCYRDLNITLSRVQRAVKLGNLVNNYYLSLQLSGTFIKPVIKPITGDIHQYSIDGKYIQSFTDEKQLKPEFNIYEVNRSIKLDKAYHGFIWVRGEKLDSVPSKENKIHKSRKIGQYTLDNELVKIWNTVRECRKEFPNVSKVLSGVAKHCHNYLFKYLE